MGTRGITQNQTIEWLAKELIDRFPERESRRLNSIKRKKARDEEKQDWSTSWERKREIRAKERFRKTKWAQD